MFLLSDMSLNQEETWNFWERRIDDILKLGYNFNLIKNFSVASFNGLIDISKLFNLPPSHLDPLDDIEKIK